MADGGLEPSVTSVRGAGRLSSQFTGGPLAPAGAGGSPVNNAANGGPSPSGSIIVGNQRRFDEDVNLPLIKVVVLGAPGVGKTSVVKRFVANEFSSEHRKTKKKVEHFPSLILNESLFEVKLIDLPVIPFFPPDSLTEWTDYRFYGLRSASAYLLVYDVSVPSSFHFVKAIREQMYESRDMTNIPVIVVGNKMDLVATTCNNTAAVKTSADKQFSHFHSFNSSHHLPDLNNGHAAANGGAATAAMVEPDLNQSTEGLSYDRKEISHLVRKTWRSAHVECSAKYNWNIVTVFRELAITLDMVANGQVIGSSNSSTRKRRCLVF